MNKLLIMFIFIITAFSIYYFKHEPERIKVSLYQLTTGEVKATVSNTRVGTIKACRRAYLAPSTGGNVAHLFIQEGDQVKQRQPLLEVWNDDLKAKLTLQHQQIKVNIATAKQICEQAAGSERDAQRLVRLKKSDHIISENQVDNAVTEAKAQRYACKASWGRVDTAKTNLTLIQLAIERTIVRAPFDGTVAEINAELGEYVTPSPPGIPTLPPIDLMDISCLKVTAPIDEVDAPALKTGMSACVSLDAFQQQQRCSGKITRIAPYVLEKEKQARTVEVEITLTDQKDLSRLLPGYSADIEVTLAHKDQALRVPTEAVLENNQVLLVTKEGLLEAHHFKPGLSNWNYIEVLSGLSKNDTIVLSVGRDGVKPGIYVSGEE